MEISIDNIKQKVRCKSLECIPLYRTVFEPSECKEIIKQYDSRCVFTLSTEQVNYDDIPNECTVMGALHCYKSPLHGDGTFKLIEFKL